MYHLWQKVYQKKYRDEHLHWWIQGVLLACASPTGSISFIFAYVFAEMCVSEVGTPPPPQWEILDLPLIWLFTQRN